MASSVASCWPASLRQNLLSIFLNLSLLQARSKGSSASDSLLRVLLEGEKSSIRLLQLPHQAIQLMEKGLLSPHYNGHLLLTMSSYSLVGSGTIARKPSDSGQNVWYTTFRLPARFKLLCSTCETCDASLPQHKGIPGEKPVKLGSGSTTRIFSGIWRVLSTGGHWPASVAIQVSAASGVASVDIASICLNGCKNKHIPQLDVFHISNSFLECLSFNTA